MFSGLIAHGGRVARYERDARGGARLVVEAPEASGDEIALGDSIAIDGVCLTVVTREGPTLGFDIIPETLQRSTLGALRGGARVNLELSLRLGDRLGGHLFFGHVDGTARITAISPEGQGVRVRLDAPDALRPYLVEKGNVALDGVSLTIAASDGGSFEVALIPETLKRTTFASRQAGDRVNVEVDPLARYAIDGAARYTHASSDELDWAYEI